MDDTISRRAAIDALTEYGNGRVVYISVKEAFRRIKQLPSAQSEIVRCVDCIYSDTFPKGADNNMPLKCLGIRYGGVMPDWYCEHAERRTDE